MRQALFCSELALTDVSAYVLTRGAWNAASPGIVLRTGAHKENLGTRLARGVNPVLVLTRRA